MGGEHHHDEPAHFTLMLNVLILAVMGLLCLLAKRRYDQHIDQSTVLHDDVKACMLNAHTLHRFNKMTQDSDAITRAVSSPLLGSQHVQSFNTRKSALW